MQFYGFGFRGKWYQTLNQALGKMIGEVEYDFRRVPAEMEDELRLYMKRVTRNVTSKFKPYSAGRNTSDRLQNRSGRAKRELNSRHNVKRTDSNKYNWNFEGSVKGPHYLNIQEDGGTLVAKDGLIAIPLPAALDGMGQPLRASPRDWKNTFTKRTKKGNVVIFQKRGRRTVPLYVLQKSVTIPARLKLGKGFDDAAPYFERKVLDRIDKLFQRP